jgi:hypothetical protein
MPDVIETAKKNKARALLLRDMSPPDFDQAHRLLHSAAQGLKTALEAEIEDRGAAPEQFELDLALQLTHVMGSDGGLFRRQGVRAESNPERRRFFLQSIQSYDSGYDLEKVYRAGKDSYTMVQRLVARVLLEPAAADNDVVVEKLHVRQELESALAVLRKQTEPGSVRENDEYAFADLSLVLLLLGYNDWGEEMSKFLKLPNAGYAISGTRDVIADLRTVAASSPEASGKLLARLDEALRIFPELGSQL